MRVLLGCCLLLAVTADLAFGQERFLLHPEGEKSSTIELFVDEPETKGPWPVILFVHGHQSSPRPGGRVFLSLDQRPALATVDEGRLQKMSERGYLAAAVSLPGYGETTGPADFWGPWSQLVLASALDHLLELSDVDRNKVTVYGVSGGAATASMLATRDQRITALILVAGLYDLGAAYPTGDSGLDAYIEREAGTTPAAFADRAALRRAEHIRAATLILHGENDRRGGVVDQARRLGDKLQAQDVLVRTHILGQTGHSIPMEVQWQTIDPFLREIVGR